MVVMEWPVMGKVLVNRPVAIAARTVAERVILALPVSFARYALLLPRCRRCQRPSLVCLIKLVGNGYDRRNVLAGRSRLRLRKRNWPDIAHPGRLDKISRIASALPRSWQVRCATANPKEALQH